MGATLALGLLLALAGSLSLYLASPHQRVLAQRWPAAPARAAGALLLACGLAALCQGMTALAAVFSFCTWLMLVFVVLPYLGAWISLQRGR